MPASSKLLAQTSQLNNKGALISALAKWTDSLFYTVQVLNYDASNGKCEVKFEDDSVHKMSREDLHLELELDKLTDDLLVCCICDDGRSKAPNELLICDACHQGYHVNCHKPRLNREKARLDEDDVEWVCATCTSLLSSAVRADQKRKPPRASSSRATPKRASPKRSSKVKLGKRPTIKRNVKLPLDTSSSSNGGSDGGTGDQTGDTESGNTSSHSTQLASTQSAPINTNEVSCKSETSTTDISANVVTSASAIAAEPTQGQPTAVLEEMDSAIINTARALASTNIKTQEFVALISPVVPPREIFKQEIEPKQKSKKFRTKADRKVNGEKKSQPRNVNGDRKEDDPSGTAAAY